VRVPAASLGGVLARLSATVRAPPLVHSAGQRPSPVQVEARRPPVALLRNLRDAPVFDLGKLRPSLPALPLSNDKTKVVPPSQPPSPSAVRVPNNGKGPAVPSRRGWDATHGASGGSEQPTNWVSPAMLSAAAAAASLAHYLPAVGCGGGRSEPGESSVQQPGASDERSTRATGGEQSIGGGSLAHSAHLADANPTCVPNDDKVLSTAFDGHTSQAPINDEVKVVDVTLSGGAAKAAAALFCASVASVAPAQRTTPAVAPGPAGPRTRPAPGSSDATATDAAVSAGAGVPAEVACNTSVAAKKSGTLPQAAAKAGEALTQGVKADAATATIAHSCAREGRNGEKGHATASRGEGLVCASTGPLFPSTAFSPACAAGASSSREPKVTTTALDVSTAGYCERPSHLPATRVIEKPRRT